MTLNLQQLFAYIADHKGTDVDQPRNFAKRGHPKTTHLRCCPQIRNPHEHYTDAAFALCRWHKFPALSTPVADLRAPSIWAVFECPRYFEFSEVPLNTTEVGAITEAGLIGHRSCCPNT